MTTSFGVSGNRWAVTLAAAGLVLVSLILPASAGARPAGTQTAGVHPDGAVGHDTSISAWSTKCGFTQTQPIDPIVHPGENPAGHVHQFFGQPNVTELSTPDSMRADPTPTKCNGPIDPRDPQGTTTLLDKSAYWVPALYPTKSKAAGTEIKPDMALVYYRNEGVDPLEIQPFPEDLSFVAGNSGATQRQDRSIVQWSCIGTKFAGEPDQIGFGTTIPASCPVLGANGIDPYQLRMAVFFPNCFFVSADQVNDTGNTAYAQPLDHRTNKIKRTCTSYGAGWIAIPQVQVGARWPTTGAPVILVDGVLSYDLSHFQLASDGVTSDGVTTGRNGMTGHADFMSGWLQSDIDALVQACYTDVQQDCGAVGGGGS